jgi:hypothetical protein
MLIFVFQLFQREHICLRSRYSITPAYICLFRGRSLATGLYTTVLTRIRIFPAQIQLIVLSY